MKRFILAIGAILISYLAADAQVVNASQDESAIDSVVYRQADAVDVKLKGRSIFDVLDKQSDNISITQDASIKSGMNSHIIKNAKKKMSGYRVRIFFDNKQDSRGASEAVAGRFRALYPGYNVYRSFANPFFKVTVGDFRTKSEANVALRVIVNDFPSAFVVREKFRFPALDPASYTVDTVRVLRKIEEVEL